MDTQTLLNKYRKILAPIVACAPENIKFYLNDTKGEEIGALYYDKEEVSKHWSLGKYIVVEQKEDGVKDIVSTWELYQLQHCCAFMVSCNVFVNKEYRSKGIGTILNQLRQDIGRYLGYSAVLCTDIEQNVHQRRILATNGWKDVYSVVNKRTTNRVYLSVITI